MKKSLSILVLMLCTVCCFAKQISIQIVQHDNCSEEVTEQSLVIEDNLLNGLFDEGYIVTNSPAEISTSENQDATFLKKGIGEAFEGYSDLFIQVKIYYATEDPSKPSKSYIEKVDWLLASAKTGVTIQDNTIKNEIGKSKLDELNTLSFNLLSEIKKAIKA